MRRFAKLIFELALTYVAVVLVMATFQRSFIYFPDSEAFVPSIWNLGELKTLPVTTPDQLSLKSWYSPPKAPDKHTVVFFQGNKGNMGLRKNKIRPLLNEGYGVFLVGYRGYNDNLGDPSEKGFYNDARGAIEALKEQGVSEGELVLYGESIGTGVATQMATEYRVAALILESPFTSLIDVGATHYPWAPIGTFLQDQYNSLSKIKKVEAPLLIVHGQADNVVPVQLARKLYEKAKEPKKLELIPGAGHNDIYEFNGQNIVQGFLEGLYTGSSTASQ